MQKNACNLPEPFVVATKFIRYPYQSSIIRYPYQACLDLTHMCKYSISLLLYKCSVSQGAYHTWLQKQRRWLFTVSPVEHGLQARCTTHHAYGCSFDLSTVTLCQGMLALEMTLLPEASFAQCGGQWPRANVPERERERDYTYPALRLIQVLPGHPLAKRAVPPRPPPKCEGRAVCGGPGTSGTSELQACRFRNVKAPCRKANEVARSMCRAAAMSTSPIAVLVCRCEVTGILQIPRRLRVCTCTYAVVTGME